MKSHIQLPASVINEFSHKELITSDEGKVNKTDFVYALRFKQTEIESIKVSDFGIEENYFDESTESLLDEKYEAPFGNVRKKLIKFSDHKIDNLVISKEDFGIIKNYVKMLLYRNKYFLELYHNNSSVDYFRPLSPSEYVNICDETNINPLPDFQKYSLTLVVSRGGKCFVNNFGGFSFINPYKEITNERMYFIPVSPHCGVLFFNPKSQDDKDKYVDHFILDDDGVFYFNKQIAITETIFGKSFLIAKNKNELAELVDYFRE